MTPPPRHPPRATSAWRDVADLEKFIVIYPDGLANQWRDCRSDATLRTSADDVSFIDALITRAAADRPIDLARVYVTGVSNGGMMSYRIAQELTGRVAGIDAVIANLPVDPADSCRAPSAPITVVIVNGTQDALTPFAGGIVALDPASGTVRSANDSRDYWVTANGCSATPVDGTLAYTDPNDLLNIRKQTDSGCRNGSQVVFFRLDGGGHSMPSKRYAEFTRQGRDIEGAEEISRALMNARRG